MGREGGGHEAVVMMDSFHQFFTMRKPPRLELVFDIAVYVVPVACVDQQVVHMGTPLTDRGEGVVRSMELRVRRKLAERV
jgi:hypothetical protein